MPRIGDRREMEAYVRSLETGSFSTAARELKLTPSAVSKLVTRLERTLGARLVSRSTRRIVATPEGELFLERCRVVLAQLEDAEAEIGRRRDRPRGLLRLHMGVGFGAFQGMKELPRFLQRYPDVELDLVMEDRRVDLARENIDVSTWTFPPEGANLHARKLFDYGTVLCASPDYLAREGTPRTPAELAGHTCMIVSGVQGQSPWAFQVDGERQLFEVRSRYTANNVDCKYRFVLAGLGIAQFSEYIVAEALRDGRLVRVLPEAHVPKHLAQYAIYQRDRHRLPRVAAMLDFLVETFGNRPWREKERPRGRLRRVV